MSTKFYPGQKIRLFNEDYTFVEHPNAPGMTFSMEGGRVFVYQVKDDRESRYALKVFKKPFRNSRLTECSQHLHRVEDLSGFKAAVRKVVESSDLAVATCPDLEYSMLMPWITGQTWSELLIRIASKGPIYDKNGAVHVCRDFLAVMSNLEKRRIAHTDISCGNVMFQLDTPHTELLDLEDLYMPNIAEPAAKTIG